MMGQEHLQNHPGTTRVAEDPVVVCAADNGFVMPLAVAVRSVVTNLDPRRKLTLFVLDGGISGENRRRLEQSWEMDRLVVHWIRPDLEALRDLSVSDQVTIAAYFRILIGKMLPNDVRKVIYLDCDLVVLGDLGLLWDQPMEGRHCLAVQDVASPYFDSEQALPDFPRRAPYLAAVRPVMNYRELGIRGQAKYFNSGILVIDLARWRQENLTDQLLDCLHQNREHVLWWDQYALNVVLAGKWGELDPRWNQLAMIHTFPSWQTSPLDEATYRRIVREPWIVHFASPSKPWHYGNSHPRRDLYFQYLDQTAWATWRPKRPPFSLSEWQYARIRRWRSLCGRQYRKLKTHLLRRSA
jgi:lipopolysaccharide biosynthesis glycosyltransferase